MSVCTGLLKPDLSQDHISLKKNHNKPHTKKEKTHAGKGELKPLLHWAVGRHRLQQQFRIPPQPANFAKEGGKDRFVVQMLSNTSNQWKKWHNEQTSMWKQFVKK